jgi:hypothetical protein
MSLRGNIEHIVHSNGIEAALVRVEEQPDTFAGSEEWNETLATALDVFRLSEQSSVRIVVGKHTLVVQQERGEQVAVALPTGHPMAKSLRRMLRRMARKDRGPLASAAPPEVRAVPHVAQSSERTPGHMHSDEGAASHAVFSF